MSEQERISVVLVYFPDVERSYPYLNDGFDLQIHDQVYVDGKLAGKLGRVIEQSFNFDIDLTKFRKVISANRFSLHNEFTQLKYHYYSNDVTALPYKDVYFSYFPPIESQIQIEASPVMLSDLDIQDFQTLNQKQQNNWYYENQEQIVYIYKDKQQVHAIVQKEQSHDYVKLQFVLDQQQLSYWVCSGFNVGISYEIELVISFIHWVQIQDNQLDSFVLIQGSELARFTQPDTKKTIKYF